MLNLDQSYFSYSVKNYIKHRKSYPDGRISKMSGKAPELCIWETPVN